MGTQSAMLCQPSAATLLGDLFAISDLYACCTRVSTAIKASVLVAVLGLCCVAQRRTQRRAYTERDALPAICGDTFGRFVRNLRLVRVLYTLLAAAQTYSRTLRIGAQERYTALLVLLEK